MENKKDSEFPEQEEFPYWLLWQDIEEESIIAKVVPWISLIVSIITLLVLMTKK